MKDLYWELEHMAYNFKTRKYEIIRSNTEFIMAKTFEEADELLHTEMNGFWRLSGKSFETIDGVNADELMDEDDTSQSMEEAVLEVIKDMDYDEFSEWLDLGSEKAIREVIELLEEEGMTEYIEISKAYINHKFKNIKKKDGEEKE